MAEWVKQLEILNNFTCTELHAAFSNFIHGLRHCYTYFTRAIPGILHLLKPLDGHESVVARICFQNN